MFVQLLEPERVGAAARPAGRGVEETAAQQPAAVAIFTALSSGRRDKRVARRASPREENPPRKHSIASFTHSASSVTLSVQFLLVL